VNAIDIGFPLRAAALLLLGIGSALAQGTTAGTSVPSSLRSSSGGTTSSTPTSQRPQSWGGSGAAASTAAHAAPAASAKSTGSGENPLARLLRQPDTASATIRGKSVTAGQVRQAIQAYAARHGKPHVRAAARSSTATGLSESALQAQNRSLLSAFQQESKALGSPAQQATMKASAVRTSGTSGTVLTDRSATGALQAGPCSSSPPGLASLTGAAQPGGILILKGRCFGSAQGQVRMYGAFPGRYVSLKIDMWADVGVAATVPPDLSGVLDQTARLQIVRADGSASNEEKMAFIARRESLQVPTSLVQLVRCSSGQDCTGQVGLDGRTAVSAFHVYTDDSEGPAFSSGVPGGNDTWQVRVGNGWALNTLELGNAFGSFQVSGFDQGPPDSAAFKIDWLTTPWSVTTRPECDFCFLTETSTLSMAVYTLNITASGPAGVSPDPSVKPPISQQPGTTGTSASAAGSMRGAPPSHGASPASWGSGSSPPSWNAPPPAAGSAGSIAGTRVSGSVRPVQVPGQPNKPAPGAPVEGSQ
jgi:hypothetical protein